MDESRDPLQSKLGLRRVHGESSENADRRERERACGLTFSRLARGRARLDAQEPRNTGAEAQEPG